MSFASALPILAKSLHSKCFHDSWSESQKRCASRSCKNMIDQKMHSIIAFYLFNRCLFSALWLKSLKVPVSSRSLHTIWILTFNKLSGWNWSFKLKSMIIFSLIPLTCVRLLSRSYLWTCARRMGFTAKCEQQSKSEALKAKQRSFVADRSIAISSNPKSQSLNLRFAGRLLEVWLAQIG